MKFLLLVLMAALAQEGDRGNHTQADTHDTDDQKCRSKCHRKHCDGFTACYRIDDEKGRAECQDQVNKDENRCMQTCDLS